MPYDAYLTLRSLDAGYGRTRVLEGVDLSIGKGEFVALLGASGCGKTTLLRTIAGFALPSAGSICVGDRDLTRLPPDKRGMAMVFQSYALWPHMTAARNIGYGLRLKGWRREAIAARVAEMEALLGLEGLGGRKPSELSGGQRQRVALGRALAVDPDILLLDEPLSNLDARIRLTVRHEIRALQQRLGITTIHVTHDREEAMVMADRIVILNKGRIAQLGTPQAIYTRPASAFVAAFMGAENVVQLNATCSANRVDIAEGPHNRAASLTLGLPAPRSGRLEARFRSEQLQLSRLGDEATDDTSCVELIGRVEAVVYPGGQWRHTVRIGKGSVLVDAAEALPPGSDVLVRVPTSGLFLFAAPADTPSGPPSAADGPSPVRDRLTA
ncbi:Fe3+/spermidine/putrescine ABC transporter ATP-binding protein [Pleomorphomonas diazotrophica]|uniref:Fe3+/spermidine/putrescine ABC transporter ATP-binding protein n=1 Tax=Pleomorphomonas diazotrophica TaxID=1166257 RepID=A0A2N3LZI8_9HYPH|nr:ABC transporter ATP-binding protein [Pleomorphomonas diazotrophica]PKR89993.1 Fe3+/spermidine/putrescine ABC transporter ATP-binding protein [Pleomorphomonas diazotrophica]